jgi:hypothetical protein
VLFFVPNADFCRNKSESGIKNLLLEWRGESRRKNRKQEKGSSGS